MLRIVLLTLLVVAGSAASGAVHAQALPGSEPISVIISPNYPRPYQTISISPRSNLVDLSASTVDIAVNGVSVYRGSGTQGANARVGSIGEKTTVTVTVTDPDGRSYSQQEIIRPAEVSLIAEPVSSTHPFYKGRGLVASEGTVRLVAVPDLRSSPTTRLPASGLIYTWRLGSRILTDASGIGKSILTAQAPVRYRNAPITVTVTTPDSSLVGEAGVLLSATDPSVHVYRNDPLLGPDFDTALTGTFSMPDTEATFRSVAYFFAIPPTLSWTVNGSASGEDKDITVRATGNGKGTAQLRLRADERSHYQSAETRVSVEFGAGKGFFGIFGL